MEIAIIATIIVQHALDIMIINACHVQLENTSLQHSLVKIATKIA
jgi:hypothetical protein